MIQFLAANEEYYQSLWIHGHSQLFQKKGMRSEARGNKWIEQIICQCTLAQIQVKLLIK